MLHCSPIAPEMECRVEALLGALRSGIGLSPAQRNLVLYIDRWLSRRQWSGNLDGFLPALEALAKR